ncbi:MAG TPA: hypothetical protein VE685_10295 [Thermoanaerobaculia bacterium]|nr:hypothetical protein [Thermoanaerobaculia bacterium]
MRKIHFAVWIVALVFAALPVSALDRVIDSGIDLWWTRGDGGTYADFSTEPIPAGFFCATSESFAGRIVFRGVPVVTEVPGALGRTDTIVHRLDNAVFNKRGVAMTRIQVRAMTFESIAPVKTACGDFNVKVSLNGGQPITRMRIIREGESGGRFLAPIAVNVKLTFLPLAGPARENLEITKNIRFAPNPQAQWAVKPGFGGMEHPGFVKVDTDGDAVPDTFLPGTSNFAGGWSGTGRVQKSTAPCHISNSCGHCTDGTTYPLPDNPPSDSSSNN